MIHDNSLAMSAPGTPPGFAGGSFAYPQATDLTAAAPGQSGPAVPVSTGQSRIPGGTPAGGQWSSQEPGESPWKRTPAAGTA